MNYYNTNKYRNIEAERRNTFVLQTLSEKRDATIVFRLPRWVKEQIKSSGKSDADFIIAELAKTMRKPFEYDEEEWKQEAENL